MPSRTTSLKAQQGKGPVETIDSGFMPGIPGALPSATVFPDGTALVAYRKADTRGSSVMLTRQIDGQWQRPQTLMSESWKPSPGAYASIGPVIARAGARAVVAWYTETGGEPQVLVMGSSDAGDRFTQAERIDLGRPTGAMDVVLLHDGTQLVAWTERQGDDASQPGGLYLRRTTAYGSTMTPALLVPEKQIDRDSQPRLGVMQDDPNLPVQLTVTYYPVGSPTAAKTLLVTLPDPAVLATADSSCGCAPNAIESSGVVIRAGIVSVAADSKTVRLRHNGIPGLIRAGQTDFAAGPELPVDVRGGLEVLAHLDEVNGRWTLLDYRVLVMPATGR